MKYASFRTLAITVAAWLVAACRATPGGIDPEIEPLDFRPFDRAMDSASASLGLAGATAVVVERDRGIVHLAGYGTFDADRLFLIASASKILSVGIIMRLADQGLLDLDAPIGQYVGSV